MITDLVTFIKRKSELAMSKWLPYERLVYRTMLSTEQVMSNLNKNIESQKSFRIGENNYTYSKPYIGFSAGNIFEIKRAISYGNSFLPQIKGEVFRDYDGTKIKVSMKPVTFVLIFMVIWFGGISIACLASISNLSIGKFNFFLLVPFGVLIFGYGIFYDFFKSESSKSKKDIKKIFEAELIS